MDRPLAPGEKYADEARRILTVAWRELLKLFPRAQAEAAHTAGGLSIDELEQRIIAIRAGTYVPVPRVFKYLPQPTRE
jgi:hypothetical protein